MSPMQDVAQRALTKVLKEFERSVTGLRFVNRSGTPYIAFPMPPGYEGWVIFQDSTYYAFVAHASEPQFVWNREVGIGFTSARTLCQRITKFFQASLAEGAHMFPPSTVPLPPPAASRPAQPKASPPPAAPFTLDRDNYPATPSIEVFEQIASILAMMFASESEPSVARGNNGPFLTLNTYSHEQLVVFGAYNSLIAVVSDRDAQGNAAARRGPFLVPHEFVHDPAAAALIAGAVFLDLLAEARDNPALPLRLRATVEDEGQHARQAGAAILEAMAAEARAGSAGPQRLRGLRTVEGLACEYYPGRL